MARKITLEEGEKLNRSPNKPILSVVGKARSNQPYLWIGNNHPADMACFATLTGTTKLRRLVHEILKAIGDER